MKNKRMLAMVAMISLLAGMLAVGGLLPASAVTDGWTAGKVDEALGFTTEETAGQYKALGRGTQLSAIMGDAEDLILGKTAYGSNYNQTVCGDTDTTVYNWYGETNCTVDNPHHRKYPGYIGGATDGKIATADNQRASTEEIFRSNDTTTRRYFYYDLGAVYNVSDFVVASCQYSGHTDRVLKNISIYVATEWGEEKEFKTHSGAFKSDKFTPVFNFSDSNSSTYIHHIQPTDGEAVLARYVCFVFTGSETATPAGSPIAISELAVYGTEVVEEEKPVLATYTHFPRYTNDLTTVVAGDSLIKGMIPYGNPYSGKDLWESTNEASWPITKLTDGKAGTNTSNDWTQIAGTSANNRFLYFDLGATYNISDFIVASAQHIGGHALLRNVRIYVAETDNDMITSVTEGVADGYTMVYENWGYAAEPTGNKSWADTAGIGNYHIVPGEGQTIVGRYVCFEIDYSTYQTANSASDTAIRIGELAVYGERVTTANKLGGQVATYVDNNTIAKLRLGFNVAVAGVARNENYEGDYTDAKVVVDGVSYDIAIDEETNLPIIGALVARSKKATDEDLVIGNTNDQVQDVHAKKIYDVYDDSITFTALITNVPSDYFDEQIIGRAYVGYQDGDTVRYVYSDLLSRSVDDVKQNTNMQ